MMAKLSWLAVVTVLLAAPTLNADKVDADLFSADEAVAPPAADLPPPPPPVEEQAAQQVGGQAAMESVVPIPTGSGELEEADQTQVPVSSTSEDEVEQSSQEVEESAVEPATQKKHIVSLASPSTEVKSQATTVAMVPDIPEVAAPHMDLSVAPDAPVEAPEKSAEEIYEAEQAAEMPAELKADKDASVAPDASVAAASVLAKLEASVAADAKPAAKASVAADASVAKPAAAELPPPPPVLQEPVDKVEDHVDPAEVAPTGAANLPAPPAMPMGKQEATPVETDSTLPPETAEMEREVTQLVMGATKGGGNFAATPMGGSVKTIKKLIQDKMLTKVLHAHKESQKELDKLIAQVHGCGKARNTAFGGVNKQLKLYKKFSPLHKSCRGLEAVKFTASTACHEELQDKRKIKDLKCSEFAEAAAKVGNENANKQIVKKGASESVDSYVRRITATVCGGAKGKGGMLDVFLMHKARCNKASLEYKKMKKDCISKRKMFVNKKVECNNLQDQMDFAACQRTVLVKDACESYAECYETKLGAYEEAMHAVRKEEKDRKSEWRALKRMDCLISSFLDGKVSDGEVTACKKKAYDTNHLIIKYPKIPKLHMCSVPNLYPSTPAYKKAEFTPLPALAKGKEDANECVGVLEISTQPKAGPKSCKCQRVTLNGPYSPGPMVRCQNCLDIRRSQDTNSCPSGTKLFAPRSAKDWKTFLASATPLRAPHWVVDVTRPANGCGGCTAHPMNSGNKFQGRGKKAWKTSDGSPWWLRSTKYNEPNGDYHANCYLDLWHTPKSEKTVTFNDGSCGYHSKSYYCQPIHVSTKPKRGSPKSCKCKKAALTGKFSAGVLIRCLGCLDVRKRTQVNSCPLGTKIFSPRSRADWKTVVDSVKPIRAPHWIVDVTRPQNGCGGCTKHPMNSGKKSQATWRTSDGSAWWLRSSKYSEPNGDYTANCYMDLWHTPSNADSVTFNDGRCNYHSNSYFCQPKLKKKKKSRR